MQHAKLKVEIQHWPYRQEICISRGVLETQTVLHASARAGDILVHGEGEQHESNEFESLKALVRGQRALPWLSELPHRATLRQRMPPDGLRNVLDAMLWDLECKQRGLRAWVPESQAGKMRRPRRRFPDVAAVPAIVWLSQRRPAICQPYHPAR